MTLVLELPPELEEQLAAEADRLGLALSEYVLRLLHEWRTSENIPILETEQVKVARALVASGQVHLPQPYSGKFPRSRQTPIKIPGKLVSEIAVEQRGEIES